MSSVRALCCSPSVKKQKHDFNFSRSMCNKTIIRFSFVISRIIEFSVRVISLSLQLWLITLTSTWIIQYITKTSSNNWLDSVHHVPPGEDTAYKMTSDAVRSKPPWRSFKPHGSCASQTRSTLACF